MFNRPEENVLVSMSGTDKRQGVANYDDLRRQGE